MEEIYKVDFIEHKNYKKYLFTDEQKQLICDLYQECGSTVTIGKMFGVNHHTIAKILKEFKIECTGKSRRRYGLNENYFDDIDTPNKAYILGFLYADGSNNRDKSTISMSLEENDFKILDAIRNEIGSEKPLEYLDYSCKHDFGYTYKNQYRLLMFSSHMCDILTKHGMMPNKSLKLEFPKWLNKDLYRHFIRGYFDGDGSVSRGKKRTNFVLTITSTYNFCNDLVDIVHKEIGVNGHIYDASNHNGITKVFATSGASQTKKFLDWIYDDAELFLQRKYDRYVDYFYSVA